MKGDKWTYKLWMNGTGNSASAFLYDNCSHACRYCIEIYSRANGGDEPGPRFEHSLDEKGLSEAFYHMKKEGLRLSFGTVSDVYQNGKDNSRTRRFLETMRAIKDSGGWIPDTNILTKSDDVLQDIDIIHGLDVKVKFSTTSYDEVARYLEPGASPTSKRIAAAETLLKKGIRTDLFFNPILPLDTEIQEDNIERIASYASEKGIPVSVGGVLGKNCAEFADKQAPKEIKHVTDNMVSVLSKNGFSPMKYRSQFEKIMKSKDSFKVSRKRNSAPDKA